MREVRPTLRVLRKLPSDFLPDEVRSVLARVDAAVDSDDKWRCLRELRLYGLNVNLLTDARSRFESGAPDRHRAATKKLRFPVYEVRDHVGQAWRGAVILDGDGDPWLAHAAPHDQFHRNAAAQMYDIHQLGKLLPSALDLRLRDEEEKIVRDQENRVSLLRSVLTALRDAVALGGDASVDLPGVLSNGVELSVAVSDIPHDGWGPDDAHEHADFVSLCLSLRTVADRDRQWVLATCLPFLQPDPAQIDQLWGPELTVSVLVTRARLVQLLADIDQVSSAPAPSRLTAPTVLHYADRDNITRAFVYGEAVRALCGNWWLPTGDDSTHADLPICPECDAERPAAQALKDLLQSRA